MQLNDFENFAIRASDVNGFSLQNSVINGKNGNDAGTDEGAMLFVNSSGTINITNSQISGGFEDNLRVLYDSATADTATYNITGNTFSRSAVGQQCPGQPAIGDHGFRLLERHLQLRQLVESCARQHVRQQRQSEPAAAARPRSGSATEFW